MTQTVRFEMVVKTALNPELAYIAGRDMLADNFKISDIGKIFQLEQDLEKFFGYRFHITCTTNDNVEEI